ncbi:hypothetical protein B9479_002205 [Cryptococcus floricola]|uniref:SET domain-containing protein n=1 Tax=Cryptococcus floricola TaxID=2591691 RepID=A0A5D3B2X3_9TREE|nr:hypothetical protein B9479_002205 [Cryptococcus floricola]
MEIPSETWKTKTNEVALTLRVSRAWSGPSTVSPSLLSDALWTVKDGLFMCTCRTPHNEDHYLVEDRIVKALQNALLVAVTNDVGPPRCLEKKRIPTRSAALHWDKSFRQDEFSWDKEGMRVRIVTLDEVAMCSTHKLESLKLVETTSLKCPDKHLGRVYVCRVLTKAKAKDGIVFQVEDPQGLVLPVQVKFPTATPCYALNLRSTLQEIYPVGAILAIREPDVRTGMKGGYVIIVDVPTDIQELHRSHPLAQMFKGVAPAAPIHELTWEEVKDLGNKALKAKNPIIAAKHYTTALRYPEVTSDPGRQLTLYLNRAQAHLDQKLYGTAYRDCVHAERFVCDPDALATYAQLAKLYWRMANAAYGLRLWSTAERLLDKCHVYSEVLEPLTAMKTKLETRKIERQYGHYNWTSILQDVQRSNAPCIDVADYQGPVDVRIIPKKNTRGLVSTRAVRAGELLLVSKSLLTSYSGDAGNAITPCIDHLNEDYIKPSSYSAISRAVHQFLDDPFSAQIFSSCNFYEYGDLSILPTWQCTEAKRLEELFKPVSDIDLSRIRNVIRDNKVHDSPVSLKATVIPRSKTNEESKEWPLMVFGMPSVMVHSCRPNVSMKLWGDVAVVRALYNMPKGTELCSNKFDTSLTYTPRSEVAFEKGFKCSCSLCRSDAKTEYDLRFRLLEEVVPKLKADFHTMLTAKMDMGTPSGWNKGKEWVKVWMQMERKLMSTYADSNKWMRGDLVETRKMLMAAWLLLDRRKAIQAMKDAMEANGCVWSSADERMSHGRLLERICAGDDSLIKDLLYPVKAFSRIQPVSTETRAFISFWARTAFWAHQILFGGDLAFFKYRFSSELPTEEEGLIYWEYNEETKKYGNGIDVPANSAPIDVKFFQGGKQQIY